MNKYLLTGVALSAMMAAGAVQAEPLTLTADQMDGVTAAGMADIKVYVDVNKHKKVNVKENYHINKKVDSFVFTLGYLATAWSDANCKTTSDGCIAQTQTVTDVTYPTKEYGFYDSTSHSQAVSASQNNIIYDLANGHERKNDGVY